MNIDEERKAFEAAVIANKIMVKIDTSSIWNGERYVSKFSSKKAYTQAMFEVWLAAKARAVEMAKPCAILTETPLGSWKLEVKNPANGLYFPVFSVSGFDDNKAIVIKWAINNGYRVIEE
jgi:hypothetical protein